jgi:hypothetical protein
MSNFFIFVLERKNSSLMMHFCTAISKTKGRSVRISFGFNGGIYMQAVLTVLDTLAASK